MLTNDHLAFPISGQFMRLSNPHKQTKIHLAILDDEHYVAIVPRRHDIWLGGSSIANDANLVCNPRITENYLSYCYELEPSLKDSTILQEGKDLRSGRQEVRLELETISGRPVIHNYGHGGSGFSLAWGCAQEVLELISSISS